MKCIITSRKLKLMSEYRRSSYRDSEREPLVASDTSVPKRRTTCTQPAIDIAAPRTKRGCTDTLCCLFFLAYLASLLFVALTSLGDGVFLAPHDRYGRRCDGETETLWNRYCIPKKDAAESTHHQCPYFDFDQASTVPAKFQSVRVPADENHNGDFSKLRTKLVPLNTPTRPLRLPKGLRCIPTQVAPEKFCRPKARFCGEKGRQDDKELGCCPEDVLDYANSKDATFSLSKSEVLFLKGAKCFAKAKGLPESGGRTQLLPPGRSFYLYVNKKKALREKIIDAPGLEAGDLSVQIESILWGVSNTDRFAYRQSFSGDGSRKNDFRKFIGLENARRYLDIDKEGFLTTPRFSTQGTGSPGFTRGRQTRFCEEFHFDNGSENAQATPSSDSELLNSLASRGFRLWYLLKTSWKTVLVFGVGLSLMLGAITFLLLPHCMRALAYMLGGAISCGVILGNGLMLAKAGWLPEAFLDQLDEDGVPEVWRYDPDDASSYRIYATFSLVLGLLVLLFLRTIAPRLKLGLQLLQTTATVLAQLPGLLWFCFLGLLLSALNLAAFSLPVLSLWGMDRDQFRGIPLAKACQEPLVLQVLVFLSQNEASQVSAILQPSLPTTSTHPAGLLLSPKVPSVMSLDPENVVDLCLGRLQAITFGGFCFGFFWNALWILAIMKVSTALCVSKWYFERADPESMFYDLENDRACGRPLYLLAVVVYLLQ